MDLTIEEALKSAVYAHKAGKLQKAETLYKAILQSQPNHPDANHNLGLLVLLMNKRELAISLFKTAINSNPMQLQFWYSYIDALIQDLQIENARTVLKQAELIGMKGNVVADFELRITASAQVLGSDQNSKITKKQLSKNKFGIPSDDELQTLLQSYQLGRYKLAEILAKSIINQAPDHLVSWKVLGAVLKQTGRYQDSLIANQKALELAPNDAETNNNLGNTLKELGRLIEAKDFYKKALRIKPNYAQAHNNLGSTLKELGFIHEAEKNYKKAIEYKNDYAEAHNNLGVTLQELGKIHEAEDNYKKAIVIRPNYAQAHCNLGVALQELGKLIEAEESYISASKIDPNQKHLHYNYGLLLYGLKRYQEAADEFKLENYKNSESFLLACFYFLNDKIEFYKLLNLLISSGKSNALIGSFGTRAEIKFGIKANNPFCNQPLNYVFKKSLNKEFDFQSIFVNPTLKLLKQNVLKYKKQGQLINGIQTSGDLFSIDSAEINEIKKIIDNELEGYKTFHKHSNEGLIRKWPKSYRLHGWLLSMKSGGELRPHIHENGWISGSIYINVPFKIKRNDGNLVVCIEDNTFLSESHQNKKNIIDVVTGTLCLFPSSLLHYTLPFESDEDRVVLAFDVVPTFIE